jgi:hypothetical protein
VSLSPTRTLIFKLMTNCLHLYFWLYFVILRYADWDKSVIILFELDVFSQFWISFSVIISWSEFDFDIKHGDNWIIRK